MDDAIDDLIRMVEYFDGAFRDQIACPLCHSVAGPFGQTGQADPQRSIDSVVVEPADSLVHDDVRRRPGAEAFAEDENFGSLLGRSFAQTSAHAIEQ